MRASAASRSNSLQGGAAVLGDAKRQLLQSFEQALGLVAAVRFDVADHHVRALGAAFARGLEHGVGLAHAGAGTEKNLQLAALLPRFVLLHPRQQRVGIGTLIRLVWRTCGARFGGGHVATLADRPSDSHPAAGLVSYASVVQLAADLWLSLAEGSHWVAAHGRKGAVMHPLAAFRFAARAARELAPVSHCGARVSHLVNLAADGACYGRSRCLPQVDRRA